MPSLLSALSWMLIHGTADTKLTLEEMVEHLEHRKLSLDCGPASALAVHILQSRGIDARTVVFQSLDWERESLFGNNHAMPEVLIDGRWELFDVDNNFALRLDGRPLSARDFIGRRIDVSAVELEVLATDVPFNSTDYQWGNRAESALPHYNLGYDYMFSSIRRFYARVLHVPLMHGAEFTGLGETDKLKILAYPQPYRYLTPATSMARYYGPQ